MGNVDSLSPTDITNTTKETIIVTVKKKKKVLEYFLKKVILLFLNNLCVALSYISSRHHGRINNYAQ